MRGALPLAAPLTDNQVSPGVLGFVVVALIGVATWLLIRSMFRQIKKIDLPDEGVPTEPPTGPSTPVRPDRGSEDG